jgi:hypothetical protein
MSLERQVEDVVKSVLNSNTRCLTKAPSTDISICHRHILMLSGISYTIQIYIYSRENAYHFRKIWPKVSDWVMRVKV